MIKLKTEAELPDIANKLGYRNHSLMIGSCFAENIGIYLQERCLPVIINPFGILYNPISIANCLELLMTQKRFTENDLFFSNGLYHSFSHHSRFSGSDPAKVLEQMNTRASDAISYLSEIGRAHV